jgi:hypothetical protein
MRQAVSRMEEELANAETAFRAYVTLCPFCPSAALPFPIRDSRDRVVKERLTTR